MAPHIIKLKKRTGGGGLKVIKFCRCHLSMAPKKDEKHAPKIKIKAGGKAKVKIIVFPPKVKANKEETTELEAADDKVTGVQFNRHLEFMA